MLKKTESNLFVGLDIGTTKVVVLVGKVGLGGHIDVIGVGSHPSRGLKRGIVINIDATVQSIEHAIEEAELMAGCEIHSVYTGIAGSQMQRKL
jgi:cell division protein FtsA